MEEEPVIRFPCNNTLRSNTSPLIDSGFFWHHSSSSLSKILSGGKQGLFWLQIISLNCAFGAFNNLLSSRIRHNWEVPWKIATLNHENQILWSLHQLPWWKLSHLRFFLQKIKIFHSNKNGWYCVSLADRKCQKTLISHSHLDCLLNLYRLDGEWLY